MYVFCLLCILQAVLEGVAAAARYPEDGANEAEDGSTGPGLGSNSSSNNSKAHLSDAEVLAAREEQWEVEERRKELLVLLKNAAKLAFPEALNFVASRLQAALSGSSSGNGTDSSNSKPSGAAAAEHGSFQDTEVAVTLLYELGEGAPEEALKPGTGGLAQLVLMLVTQGQSLPAGHHRLVALAVLETCARYCR